jgi:hypothetical protein
MSRFFAALVASLALSAPAWAGFGATAAMPVGGSALLAAAMGGGAPTFDYRNAKLLVQVPVLDILGSVTDEVDGTNLGVSASFMARSSEISKATEGVVMPGLGLQLGSFGTGIGLHARVGAELKDKGTGLGIYVVPRLGVVLPKGGDSVITAGGAVEISGWFSP